MRPFCKSPFLPLPWLRLCARRSRGHWLPRLARVMNSTLPRCPVFPLGLGAWWNWIGAIKEANMQRIDMWKRFLRIWVVAGVPFFCSAVARGQEVRSAASSSPSTSEAPDEIRALSGLVRDLQAQVQTLNSQLGEL